MGRPDRCRSRRVCSEWAGALFAVLTLDPAPSVGQSTLWTVSASAPASAFGDPLGEWLDSNGDGKQELLVGEPAFVAVPGGAVGRVAILSGATGATLTSIQGSLGAGSGFGLGLGPAADVTGDGVPELFVGAVGVNQTRVLTTAGLVLQTYPGRTCVSPGDFDGDGQPDVVVGEPWWSPFGTWQGRIRVYSGTSLNVLFENGGTLSGETRGFGLIPIENHPWGGCAAFVSVAMGGWGVIYFPSTITAFCAPSGTPEWLVSSPQGGVALGYDVANVGDVDGDGWDDLLLGAPWDANTWIGQLSDGAGRAFLVSGGTGATLLVMIGPVPQLQLGRSVGSVGDLDGDGIPDLLVGASAVPVWLNMVLGFATSAPYLGRVYVFSGAGGALLHMLEESPPGDGFGSGVAGLGDIDGDDYPDFAASEPYKGTSTPGSVSAFAGRPAGVDVFGQGCAGSGGLIPRLSAWPAPQVGSTVALHVSRALGGTSGLLVLGASSTSWLGVPLPLNLAGLGMPGCSLAVSPDLALGLVLTGSGPGGGRGTVSLAIPADPTLVGYQVYAQGYLVDPGPSALPGVVTRGLELTILP